MTKKLLLIAFTSAIGTIGATFMFNGSPAGGGFVVACCVVSLVTEQIPDYFKSKHNNDN